MGKSTAERQREYRERHADEAERISMLVSVSAKRALERLARHHGQTQRVVLEALLRGADRAVVDTLGDTRLYYDGPLPANDA